MKTKTVTPTKTPLELVKEIHTKVETYGDRCVKEANDLLAHAADKETAELHDKMTKLGFGKVKEIRENKEEIEKRRLALERSRIIGEYAIRYPHKKFIAAEEMDKICAEYGLILGADQHFIGEIPERSMREIVNFKLQEQDELYHIGHTRIISGAGTSKAQSVVDWSPISKEEFNKATNEGKNLVTANKRTHYISNKNYFMVGAPKNMFEIEGMVVEGNQLKQIVEINDNLDPVCLKPVKFGYIVVALWGEEAAIRAMQNPTSN